MPVKLTVQKATASGRSLTFAVCNLYSFGQCQFNSHTYCLISVVILIILIIYLNVTAVLQLFAFGIFLTIGNKYEYVVQYYYEYAITGIC